MDDGFELNQRRIVSSEEGGQESKAVTCWNGLLVDTEGS